MSAPDLSKSWIVRVKLWCDRHSLPLLAHLALDGMFAECYRDGFAAGRLSVSQDVHTHATPSEAP